MKGWLSLASMVLILTACSTLQPGTAGASIPESPAAPSASPTSAGTATPTIDWFPATATPTLPATLPPRPTEDLHPDLGPILLQDDFSQTGAWQTKQTSVGTIAYGKNELSLAIPNVRSSLFSLRSLRSQPDLGDFYLEITAMPELCRGSDAYGLLLRAASAEDYYRWILTCDGQMRLERLQGQMVAVVQDWTPRAARPGATRLGVWASGPKMRFFLDDILQFEVRDPIFPSGSVGVFARSNGENSLTVSFSDLVIRQVVGGKAAATPTMGPTPRPTVKH